MAISPIKTPFIRAAAVALILLPGAALAQSGNRPAAAPSASEQLVRGWLNGLVAPGLAVEPGSFAYDQASDTLTVTDTRFARDVAGKPGVKSYIAVGKTVFVGLANGPRSLSAKSISVQDVKMTVDGVEGGVSLASATIDSMDLPTQGALTFDPQKPVSSHARLLREVSRSTIRSVILAGLELRQRHEATDMTARVERIALGDIAGGRLASLDIGPLFSVTADAGKEVARFDLGGVSLKGFDLNAYIRMFEPSAYLSATSERPWMTLAETLTFKGLKSVEANGTLSIAGAEAGPLKLRQFPQDLTPILDQAALDPEFLKKNEDAGGLVASSMLDAVSLDAGTISDLAVHTEELVGKHDVTVASASLAGLSARGLGSFQLQKVSITDAGGKVTIDKALIGRIALPPPQVLVESQKAARAGTPTDPLALAPTVGQFELSGVNVATAPATFTLGALKLDLNYYIRAIPTNVRASLSNLVIPGQSIQDARLKQSLADLGYDKLDISADVVGTWVDSANEVNFERISLSAAGMGSLTASGSITNIPRSVFENPRTAQAQLVAAGLRKLRLNYTESSLFGKAMIQIATQTKQTPEQLKKALVTNMPAILSSVPDPTLRNRLTFALIAFLNDAKSIEIFSTTNDPVPFAQILGVAATAPQTLPVVLKLDVVANRK